jgi:hypothetical protein
MQILYEWIIGTPDRTESKIIPIQTRSRYGPGSVYNVSPNLNCTLVLQPLLLFYLVTYYLSTDTAGVQFDGQMLESMHRRHAFKINYETIFLNTMYKFIYELIPRQILHA